MNAEFYKSSGQISSKSQRSTSSVNRDLAHLDGEASIQSAVSRPFDQETSRFSELLKSRLAFSVKESAEILGVSEKTIRRLIQRKLLKSSLAIRHKLISKKELERFLEATIGD